MPLKEQKKTRRAAPHKPSSRTAALPAAADREREVPVAAVPIIGMGASAGGLEAFEQFFRACPADTGIAFVLVPHLAPGHESLLTEILQRATAMPVAQALDQVRVQANHVYIIPPNREMTILNGALQLQLPEKVHGKRMPIDTFLCSLAEDQGDKSIGVILSGTATDGTLGAREILGAGGVCMVQDPAEAKYDGMPNSAITAGYVTHILPVEEMPAKLLEVIGQSVFRQKVPALATGKSLDGLNDILLQLRRATGHDFSLYKKSTISRRIERRMAQHDIQELSVYARYLKANPAEVEVLFKELLINVTSFFRDPEAFATLKSTILPPMLAGKPRGYVFRVWVAGCSSGEEAYSIAMVVRELLEDVKAGREPEVDVQIYATDLDDDAIAIARAGCYPPNIAQDVTPERLRRFFVKDAGNIGGYKVKKEIRDMVVFAVQNIIKDPPFTKLDLLSCRNLLIYLEQELQNRLIPNFHYALKPDGVLFLSASESIVSHAELFSTLDRKWKFYRARHTAATTYPGRLGKPFQAGHKVDEPAIVVPRPGVLADLSERVLLQNYAPASVTTNARGDILYVHGDTGKYLRPAPGPVTSNVIAMARDGLQRDLRAAILNVATHAAPTLDREVSVKTNGGYTNVRFSVRLLPGPRADAGTEVDERLLLVTFQDVAGPDSPAQTPTRKAVPRQGRSKQAAPAVDSARAEELERELAHARENLQVTIEELQATNEELKSTNEELQSTNEELQSTNEELETSKEELQSLNEETVTVNSELNAKVDELTGIQNDMKNLLDSVNIGILFIDYHLAIRRYTRDAVKIYRLINSDVGRPLSDIKSNLEGDDLQGDLQAVLETLIPREREVCTVDGVWYLARIQPYRTLDNVIDGLVLTFTDIAASRTAARLKLDAAQVARELAEGIVNTVVEPLIVLDGGLQVISASRSFFRHFQVTPEETVGQKIYDLGNGQWDIPALRQLIENILPREQVLEGYVVEHDFPVLGRRRMVLNARRIVTAAGDTELILLAMVALEPVQMP